MGQSATLRGIVLNELNEPLEGVNIVSDTKGTTTNSNGFYIIKIPANTDVKIRFSHVNNKNVEVKVKLESDTIIKDIEERLKTADLAAGKLLIKKCVACHSFKVDGPNKIGPNLSNIYLRQIASLENFKYSKALLNIKGPWNNKNLDNFLLNPKKWVPGTQMSFVGIKKDNDRANIIKYLQSL